MNEKAAARLSSKERRLKPRNPLATAALFDLGVFIVVVGATLLALLVPGLLADPVRVPSGPKEAR